MFILFTFAHQAPKYYLFTLLDDPKHEACFQPQWIIQIDNDEPSDGLSHTASCNFHEKFVQLFCFYYLPSRLWRKISMYTILFYAKRIMLIVVVFLFSRKFILKLLTRSLLFIVYYVHTISPPGRCARTPWLLRTCKQKWPDLDSYRLVKSWASYASSLADRLTATPTTRCCSQSRRRVRWSFGISQWDKNKCINIYFVIILLNQIN